MGREKGREREIFCVGAGDGRFLLRCDFSEQARGMERKFFFFDGATKRDPLFLCRTEGGGGAGAVERWEERKAERGIFSAWGRRMGAFFCGVIFPSGRGDEQKEKKERGSEKRKRQGKLPFIWL